MVGIEIILLFFAMVMPVVHSGTRPSHQTGGEVEHPKDNLFLEDGFDLLLETGINNALNLE